MSAASLTPWMEVVRNGALIEDFTVTNLAKSQKSRLQNAEEGRCVRESGREADLEHQGVDAAEWPHRQPHSTGQPTCQDTKLCGGSLSCHVLRHGQRRIKGV